MPEKKCPSCGVMNAAGRMTCVACHEKLSGTPPAKPETINPFKDAEQPEKDASKPKRVRKPRVRKDTPVKDAPAPSHLNPTLPSSQELEKPIRKTRTRRRVTKSAPVVLLALVNGKLVPVKMVTRMVRVKDAGTEAKAIASLWARTRKLINK